MRHLSRFIVIVALAIMTSTLCLAAAERTHTIVPEDYFGLTSLGNLVVSPQGQLVAYTESRWGNGDAGRTRELWVVGRQKGLPQRLTFGNFGAGSLTWSPAGDRLYFIGRDRAGRDTPPHDGSAQVWRINPDGTDLQPVTRVDDGVGSFQLAPDGASLYYTVDVEKTDEQWQDLRQQYADLDYGHGVRDLTAVRQLDLVTWRDHEVIAPTQVIWEMALSPDGQRLGLITTTDNELIFMEGWSRVEIIDLATGQATAVTDPAWRTDHPSPFGWLENLAWSADSQALAFSISYDGFASRIWSADRTTDAWNLQLINRPDMVSLAGGLQWRGTGRTLCYLGETMGRVHVYATEGVKASKQGKTRMIAGGDIVSSAYDFDAKGKSLTTIFETTTAGNDIYTVKSADKFTRRTLVNPQIDTWQLPQIEHVSWTGADGDICHGILELPAGYQKSDGPLPTIIELHGGPTSSTKYRLRLWIYGRALMPANGYALLSPNYHGSTGYGDEFLEKLIGRENEIEVADITLGVKWLIAEGIADPAKMGVMGWSNGGYLTNCMITSEPDMFAAASSGAGTLDMVIQWGTEDTPGHVINFVKGLPWNQAEHYQAASPLYNLDKVRTPTLIHVGGNDPRVPPAHSRALYRALRHYLDVPTELIVYPGEPHGLTTHENRLAKMEWDLAWFRKYLLGEDE